MSDSTRRLDHSPDDYAGRNHCKYCTLHTLFSPAPCLPRFRYLGILRRPGGLDGQRQSGMPGFLPAEVKADLGGCADLFEMLEALVEIQQRLGDMVPVFTGFAHVLGSNDGDFQFRVRWFHAGYPLCANSITYIPSISNIFPLSFLIFTVKLIFRGRVAKLRGSLNEGRSLCASHW